MFDDDLLHEVLDMIKKIISTKTFYDIEILIETDNKLSDDITSENLVTVTSCVIKDNDKIYLQIIWRKALHVE